MIWIMNNLVLINIMTGGGPLYFSETIPVYMYKLGFKYTKLSQAAAMTVINFIILLFMASVYLYLLEFLIFHGLFSNSNYQIFPDI